MIAMETSLPVALQYLYGGSAVVQKGEGVEEDAVIEGSEVEEVKRLTEPVYPYNIFDKVEEEESENVEEIIMGNRKKFKPSDSEKPTGGRRRIKRKDTNNNNSHRQDFEDNQGCFVDQMLGE